MIAVGFCIASFVTQSCRFPGVEAGHGAGTPGVLMAHSRVARGLVAKAWKPNRSNDNIVVSHFHPLPMPCIARQSVYN